MSPLACLGVDVRPCLSYSWLIPSITRSSQILVKYCTIVDPKMWLMDEILLSDGQTFGMLLYQWDFYYINFRDLYSSPMGCKPWDIYYIKCFSVSFINSMSLGAMRQSRYSSPIDPFCRHVEPITIPEHGAQIVIQHSAKTWGQNTWHISS